MVQASTTILLGSVFHMYLWACLFMPEANKSISGEKTNSLKISLYTDGHIISSVLSLNCQDILFATTLVLPGMCAQIPICPC